MFIHLKSMLAGRILRLSSVVNALRSPIVEVACPEALEGPSRTCPPKPWRRRKAWISVDWKNQKLSLTLLVAALALQPGCQFSLGDNQSNDDLILAAESGDVQGVQKALDAGANVNAQAPGAPDSPLQNMAALRQAAQNGHAPVVKLLLENGAQTDIVDSLGATPLIAAAQNGHLEPIQILLDYGANVQAQAAGLGDATALLIASQNGHLPVVQYLIEQGADVNAQAAGLQNATALRMAAQNGHLPVVQALVDAGADVNAVDGLGFTPLSIAQKGGHTDVVEFLKSAGATS